jgi:hypothetical protein
MIRQADVLNDIKNARPFLITCDMGDQLISGRVHRQASQTLSLEAFFHS